MKILLLAAMDKEISLLLNLLENPQEKTIQSFKVWNGTLYEHEIWISKCGIGKVNSALNTILLLQAICPELVINSGVAGGAGLAVGSVLIADQVAYHDVWCGPGTDYGQAEGFPLFFSPSKKILEIEDSPNVCLGLICSGDKFISTPEEISFIRSKFPSVKAVDMESASIAQTCMSYGTDFAIVRVVSDTPGEGENISQYKDFWENAPQKTFDILSQILKNLK